jgi:D-alanine-D-alanine ligase
MTTVTRFAAIYPGRNMEPELSKWKNKTVGVLMGGDSSEREVSLKSGRACADALLRLGYRVRTIDVDADVATTLRREQVEVAFIALHGHPGEDGCVQGLLEIAGIPYTGSGVLASAIGMSKLASRALFIHHHIPMPPGFSMTHGESLPDPLPFDFPVVVKPVSQGSSLGVSIVATPANMGEAIEAAFGYDPQIVVEQYIPGREIQVGILNDEAIGTMEVRPKSGFYDYAAKYMPGMSEHLCPAPLSDATSKAVMAVALRVHRVLGCRGATRVDLRLTDADQPYVLEINTLPGMTETSLLPDIARSCGIDFDQLVEKILDTAALESKRAS